MKRSVAMAILVPFLAPAQSDAPAFEAADVHVSPKVTMPFLDVGFPPTGRYQMKNATMVDLIKTAWNIDGESVSGGPTWLDTDRFDVIAKTSSNSTEADRAAMLRALLADRFKLRVHNDQKELTVYAMTVNKRGVQFQESGTIPNTSCKPDFSQGPPQMIMVACPSTPNDAEAIKKIPAPTTEFEAATIKVNKSGGQMKRIQPKPGGRIEVENLKLADLITIAWNFDFDNDRVVGLPKWAEADAYDIIAKTAILPGEKPPAFDDLKVMLRSLLIERFNIKTHEEQQPVKVWTLTVAKRGAKLKEADPSTRSNCTPSMGQAGSGSAALPAITYTCQNTTITQLAEAMHRTAGGYVDHPVFDLTNLKGSYDFAITWTPRGALSSSKRAETGQPDTASDPSGGTTFFEAVEKQLGLHLEGGQRHPMMVLVIDHIAPLSADN